MQNDDLFSDAPAPIPGNIDLENRPIVHNQNNTISTVRSMSFNEGGKEILVPTVSDDGRIMSPEESIQNYHQTGKHLGMFNSVDEANSYAETLHQAQDKMYSPKVNSLFTDDPIPSISQPKTPMATTYVPDKNLVVGHSADLSHDQVNDAVQTQVFNKPRTNWFKDALPVAADVISRMNIPFLSTPVQLGEQTTPKELAMTGKELVKSVPRFSDQLGIGVGGLLKWIGESTQAPADALNIGKISEGFTALGDAAINTWSKTLEKGWEAPDPEMYRSASSTNPSFVRIAAEVAQTIPTVMAAGALTLATGNPLAGPSALGLLGTGQQYSTSRKAGQSPTRAGLVAGVEGIGNTLLMELPINGWLKGFGSRVEATGSFVATTAVMNPFNNIMAKLGGDKARKLFDGITEQLFSAAISANVLHSLTPGRGAEIDQMIQDTHKAGVSSKDIDAARAEIGKQMAENPNAIQSAIKITQEGEQSNKMVDQANQILEKNPDLKSSATAIYRHVKNQLDALPDTSFSVPEGRDAYTDTAAKVAAAHWIAISYKEGVDPIERWNKYNISMITPEESPKMPERIQLDKEGVPKINKRSVVASGINEATGEPFEITHRMVLDRAEADRQDALDAWRRDREDDLLKQTGRIRWTKELDQLGDFEAMPWSMKKLFFTKDRSAPELDAKAQDLGMEGKDLIKKIIDYEYRKAPDTKLGSYYGTAQHRLEEDFTTYREPKPEMPETPTAQPSFAQEPNEAPIQPGEQTSGETEVAPGVFFQNEPGLFGVHSENVADRYNRLREQALSQGMNPVQATKYARENLGKPEVKTSEPRAKQTEFDAGGVQSFGKGTKETQELFQSQQMAPTFYSKLDQTIQEKMPALDITPSMKNPSFKKDNRYSKVKVEMFEARRSSLPKEP